MRSPPALALLLLASSAGALVTPPPPEGVASQRWRRGQQSIHYERAPADPAPPLAEAAPSVLLLNGFGVGTFHWHRNLAPLAAATGGLVFAMDYVGQGGSWPLDCADGEAPSERGLGYSIDEWLDQTESFIAQVVLPAAPAAPAMVHLVGNSCGGLIAAHLAARRPDLVASITLLNATPLWGSRLPAWDGKLPGPALPRAIGRYAYDRMRDEGNIATMLGSVYGDSGAVGDELPAQIRAMTETTGGHAAFASILWSRPATPPAAATPPVSTFEQLLARVRCDALLLYGARDPWCSPPFGRSAARALSARGPDVAGAPDAAPSAERLAPRTEYVELDVAGHCPHHECPAAVNTVVARWVNGEPVLQTTDAPAEERFQEGEGLGEVAARRVARFEATSPWETALTSLFA